MNERLPMSSAELDETDVEAVAAVVRSGRLALGQRTREFESAVARYTGAKHALAVSSGTAALHLIVRAMGIGPGDEVLVPSFTFAASANAILYERATPVFVDCDPGTYNLDVADVERKITTRTKAIMVVDVFGHPAAWTQIEALARRHGLRVIDDSCEALGASYRGRRLGTFGDASAFAFYPNKQLTTGEGGMIVTNDDEIARLCASMRNQGRGEMGAWLSHERLGYNYRLDEMSAALGLSQMKRLDSFLAKRERVAQMYSDRLAKLDWVTTPVVLPHVTMSWFVYVVTLADGLDRDRVIEGLEARGIPARGYFSPVHLQPYVMKELGTKAGSLPVTESIATRTLALPFHNNLTLDEINKVVETLRDVVAELYPKIASR